MRRRKQLMVAILAALWIGAALVAQTPEGQTPAEAAPPAWLKGLHKATDTPTPSSQPKRIDLASLMVFLEDGKRLEAMELMQAMQSGDYTTERWVDDQGELKALVLRPASAEVKKVMKSMQASALGASERIGRVARPFAVRDLAGRSFELGQLAGKIVVLNFWFVECMPCRAEIPELNALVEAFADKGVVFLAPASNTAAQLQEFLEKNPFRYDVVPDAKAMATDYEIAGYPAHVIIGRDGKIAHFTAGFSPDTVQMLRTKLEELLKK